MESIAAATCPQEARQVLRGHFANLEKLLSDWSQLHQQIVGGIARATAAQSRLLGVCAHIAPGRLLP